MSNRKPTKTSRPPQLGLAAILFCVATALFIIAVIIVASKTSGHIRITAGTNTNVSQATLLKNYTIRYPVFHDATLDAVIGNYTKSQIEAFEKKLAGKNNINDHLTVAYELNHVGKSVISITFNSKERIMGLPDTHFIHRIVLDTRKKKQLAVQDVIVQNLEARRSLAILLHDYFKQSGLVSLPLELVNLLELQLSDLRNFSLEADALILYLNPHQPSITDTGLKSVAISKTLLTGILNEAYITTEADTQPVQRLGVEYRIDSSPVSGDTINSGQPMLALTFDDGPGDLTPALLDQLRTYRSHATFFALGHLADTYRATLQREIREGNEIGNHSWSHPDLRLLSIEGLNQQVLGTQAAIQAATGGYAPRLMRPPYGGTNPAVHQYLETHGFTQALWNVDTNDWLDRNADLIYNRIMGSAGDGRVILLHDIHPTSVQAAIKAIRELKVRGFQLVTLSDLYRYRGL